MDHVKNKEIIVRLNYLILTLLLVFSTRLIAEPIAMVTGSETGTYIQFGKNIASVSEKSGQPILVKKSKGSIDNIIRMMSTENAAFAIVQSDVLGYLSKSTKPKFRRAAKRLRLIFPFYNEEVHLFARKEIKNIDDLQGKIVVVGPKSSGTNMTAWNILKMTGVQPKKRINVKINEGIKLVLKNKADAVFVVAGKPRPGFKNLFNTPKDSVKAMLQDVHFVPLNDKALLAEYENSNISNQDYPSFMDNTIPTVAVKALLVSFDFSSGNTSYYKQRCQQLYKISQVIRQNIDQLKNNKKKYHKKWNEVNLKGDMGGWSIDKCSHSEQPPADMVETEKEAEKETTIDDDIDCSFDRTCP